MVAVQEALVLASADKVIGALNVIGVLPASCTVMWVQLFNAYRLPDHFIYEVAHGANAQLYCVSRVMDANHLEVSFSLRAPF